MTSLLSCSWYYLCWYPPSEQTNTMKATCNVEILLRQCGGWLISTFISLLFTQTIYTSIVAQESWKNSCFVPLSWFSLVCAITISRVVSLLSVLNSYHAHLEELQGTQESASVGRIHFKRHCSNYCRDAQKHLPQIFLWLNINDTKRLSSQGSKPKSIWRIQHKRVCQCIIYSASIHRECFF